jgi:hypothetical protein
LYTTPKLFVSITAFEFLMVGWFLRFPQHS